MPIPRGSGIWRQLPLVAALVLATAGAARAQGPSGVIVDSFDPGADQDVLSIVVQPDGKILVGGSFRFIGGGGSGELGRIGIARLHPDGSVDETFDAGDSIGRYGNVRAIAVQPDGKIVVGGDDIGEGRNILRLNPDGSLDTTFETSADFFVFALAVQPDGKIVVGGAFAALQSGDDQPAPRFGIGRLNSDGSVDAGFVADLDSFGRVEALALQPDGRILVGGTFSTLGGLPRENLGRLDSNGAVDTSFDPGVGSDLELPALVTTLTLQPDGSILVGGAFQRLGGGGPGVTMRPNIGRLHPDGSLDVTFDPPPEGFAGEASSIVESIVVLPNGQILAGGFAVAEREPEEVGRHIARYNSDGSLDSGFDANADTTIHELAVQQDGLVLAGGDFESIGGQPRIHLARLDVGIPGVPTISAITPGDRQLSVAFVPPSSGFPITNYEYSTDGGATWTPRSPASAASPIVIAGLVNGTTYPVALRASTATGVGNPSLAVSATPLTTPGAPTIGTVTPGNGQLTVAFVAPSSDGGAAITNYEYSTDGGFTWTPRSPASTASPLVITGLTNGNSYQVALRAINSAGAGAPSGTAAGLPSTTPSAPLVTGITLGNGRLTVIFLAGPDGGLPITNYEFSTDGGATWQPRVPAATTSPIVIAGLENGTTYGVRIRARNDNGAGEATPTIAATPQASLDEAVDAFNPGADGEVRTLAVQPDGRILVGGQFTRLGENATLPRNNLGRVNADGSVDDTFNPVNIGPSSIVSAVLLQSDGRIVLAGDGPDPSGERTYTARLNADGSFDGSFQGAANGPIYALAQQPDGKILIGGNFTVVGLNDEWPRLNLARLNADGTADTTFDPGVNGVVEAIVVQPDGRIIIGGAFSAVGSVPRSNLARLHPDGSLDFGFVGGATGGSFTGPAAFSGSGVAALWLQSDGKILVGGRFALLGGGTGTGVRHNIGRLNADGTLDPTFDAGTGSSDSAAIVEAVLVLPTNRILIGGRSVAAVHDDGTARHLARLHPDGSLDVEFEPRPDLEVRALALQADGKVVVGGRFTTIGGDTRHRLARLGGSGPSSPATPAPPVPFTDDPLVAGTTPLRAVHIVELRTRIDALRQRFNLPAVNWTDAVLAGVPARAVHVQELRDALLAAFDAALLQGIGAPRPVFADDPLGPGLPIRALHIEQLRAAVVLLEGL